MRKLLVLLVGLLFVGNFGVVSASTVNVDFGFANTNIYSGTGAAADTGTSWNGLDFNGGNNLLDSFGVATGISVTTDASQAYDDQLANSLLTDRIFVTESWGAFTVNISGLNDLFTYDLFLYGSNTSYSSNYSSGTANDYVLGEQSLGSWVRNQNYALLENLSSSSGLLNFNVDKYQPSSAAVIGGFQLVEIAPIPEPATMLLFGLGLLGVAGVSRRKE